MTEATLGRNFMAGSGCHRSFWIICQPLCGQITDEHLSVAQPGPLNPVNSIPVPATTIHLVGLRRSLVRDLLDLQNNKALTTKWMKWVSYLRRSQRLAGPKCSSTQSCLLSATESYSKHWFR